jgi:predicted nuclease of predicted toxin-antitoxin system
LIDPAEVRLVLDQGIPRDAATLLRRMGYVCTHVGEIGMWMATDHEILAWAAQQKATVITLDADFHTILAVSAAAAPSVIRIRMQGLDSTAAVEIIRRVVAHYEADLTSGALVTVKARKITCHRLPIGGILD